jgi:Mn2+/Fe2+ NRAMP family transporter
LIGMTVGLLALSWGERPVRLIIFGQALTVLGNPLMAATMLYLANRADVMGARRNSVITNIVAGLGLIVVLLGATRVLYVVVLRLS